MKLQFKDFESELRAQGFDQVLEKEYPPDAVIKTHVHSFAAKALIVRGEMWLTIGDHIQHIVTGGTFELEPGTPHSERYGPEGTAYWVGRRELK
jgi:quercetin dioxygenase-like cupin family protein